MVITKKDAVVVLTDDEQKYLSFMLKDALQFYAEMNQSEIFPDDIFEDLDENSDVMRNIIADENFKNKLKTIGLL